MRRLLALASATALVLSLGACATDVDDEPVSDDEAAVRERYDIHQLLTDDDLRGGRGITVADVQGFLESKGSYLARYEDPRSGKSAAEIIHAACTRYEINPVYMLARIQVESSLVGSGRSRGLDTATGCACPDGGGCASGESGFAKQIDCAGRLTSAYFDEIAERGVTRAGWGVGVSKRTLDPCSVKPKNKATAVIYTYTPWVGTRGQQCSSNGSSGSTTLVSIYKSYARAFSAGG